MMVDDIILKGQGVTFEKDGIVYPMSFPERDDINPFFVDSETGEQLDDSLYPHKWPMEAAATKLAHDIMENNPQIDWKTALHYAKYALNLSAEEFNKSADKYHTIPLYFNPHTGELNPEWSQQTYGFYQDKKKFDTRARRTKDSRGNVVTFHVNNVPHPAFGHFPETGVFPSFRELREILSNWGHNHGLSIPTSLALYPHIEPQDMVTSGDGTEMYSQGPVRRHRTTDPDPFGPSGSTLMERNTRQNVSMHSILNGLDSMFLQPLGGNYSPRAARQLSRLHGLNEEESQLLASTAAGSFWNYGRVRGDRSAVASVSRALKERLYQLGYTEEELHRDIESHIRAYRAIDMETAGVDNRNGNQLLRALALSQISRERGTHSDEQHPEEGAHPIARNALNVVTANAPQASLERRDRMEGDIPTSHIRPNLPHNHSGFWDYNVDPASLAPSPSTGVEPGQVGRSPGDADTIGPYAQNRTESSTVIEQSHDTLHSLMENLQMADAKLDSSIMKSVPYYKDYESIAKAYSLSMNDVRAIEQSVGDWDKIAKSLMITPSVVKGVKVSLG